MGIYQDDLKQCQQIEENILSIKKKSISLHNQAINLGMWDTDVVQINSEVKTLKKETEKCKQKVKATNDSLQTMVENINSNNKVDPGTYYEIEKIQQLSYSINAYISSSEVYINKCVQYISTQNIWGAIITILQDIVSILEGTVLITFKTIGVSVKGGMILGYPVYKRIRGALDNFLLPPGK